MYELCVCSACMGTEKLKHFSEVLSVRTFTLQANQIIRTFHEMPSLSRMYHHEIIHGKV